MNDVRWTRGGHRGGGAQLPNNAQDYPFERSTAVPAAALMSTININLHLVVYTTPVATVWTVQ